MKKLIFTILTLILLLNNIIFASTPIFLTEGRFYTKDLETGVNLNGISIEELVGKYEVYSPVVTILYIAEDGYPAVYCAPEKAVLVGINDTEDPDIKLLKFAFRRHDGGNWKAKSYDFHEIGIENLHTWISIDLKCGTKMCIDDYNPIILFDEPDKWDEFGKILFGEKDTNETRMFKSQERPW